MKTVSEVYKNSNRGREGDLSPLTVSEVYINSNKAGKRDLSPLAGQSGGVQAIELRGLEWD